MEYKIIESDIAHKYQDIYLKARKCKSEVLCFTGADKEYRFTVRDSYYDSITDTDTLLEYCLYPLYAKGYTEIKDEVQEIIKKMAASNDVLQVFQVFNFIVSQEVNASLCTNLPFEIDFTDIIDTLQQNKDKLKKKMMDYNEHGFNRFKTSIWDCIEFMCKNSKILKASNS